MRGGLQRWKRGAGSQGVRQALAYAFQGSCDAPRRMGAGVGALAAYGDTAGGVTRYVVDEGLITRDDLNDQGLRRWVDGCDPTTGERRGRDLQSEKADLILDGTINAPKSYSIAALLDPDLAGEFEALQDRLRDRVIVIWQRELNARRGAGGRVREGLRRVEVVELQHRRSRALDPHIHRHLWLNVKVLGGDCQWSNIDSRVAMKLHTVINAEGELAARTDPQWVAALARHGFTIGGDGEIAELAHAVRPLSRRSSQIEANRALLLGRWRSEHPGQEPGPDHLHQIDRLAWAKGRPNKPKSVDEDAWAKMIADELAAIDPALTAQRRGAILLHATKLAELDLPLVAARAIVEADARSAACGGRFSLFDVRGGAIRAIAASGVVNERYELQGVVDEVIALALAHTVDLLSEAGGHPAHVKGLMAQTTAASKIELASRFDALTEPGVSAALPTVIAVSAQVLREDLSLDERQVAAAAAIAGTDRLVSITGPAGAGKTTMLRVAKGVLAREGRAMVVVAPTKKAASVAGREIGTNASSLHALLADHGWRWARDDAGAETWTRLRPGETDPSVGTVFAGPRLFHIRPGDRIVVDEAAMVDLHTANALATLASETGAGVAMVGDHLQARPVGHSGAMACLTRRATAVVELTAVHRFRDPEYAALTLRMREPESKDAAANVAGDLDARGLIRRVDDQLQAHEVMVENYFRWASGHHRVALVTSTNDEADAINEAIQDRRIQLGQLSLGRVAIGQADQRLLEGDVVQTRRNDKNADVENRALWTLNRIRSDGIEIVSLSDSGDIRTVSLDYAASHVHLAYASTVHGIQGETTDASIVGPGVDASGLYVGMTRGRVYNEAIAIARTSAAARNAIADSMLRGIREVSIEDSIRAARTELSRAARPPETDSSPSGAARNDTPRRTRGTVNNNDEMVHVNQGSEHELQVRLDQRKNWLRSAKRTLLDLDAQIGEMLANEHGREDGEPSNRLLQESRNRLVNRFEVRSREYKKMAGNYRTAVATVNPAKAAHSNHSLLDGHSLLKEDGGRREASTTPVPLSAVRGEGLGR